MKWVELFAGIGGASAALDGRGPVLRAIDHDETAHAVYTANWPHPAHRINLDSVKPRLLEDADAWWMSPPCQPYTVRGKRRDVDDPRARSLLHLLELIETLQPRALAMENVPGFSGSVAHARLRATLRRCGYHVHEQELCPTRIGVPMVRNRWYLVADRQGAVAPRVEPVEERTVADAIDGSIRPDTDPSLFATEELVSRYGSNLPVVDPSDAHAVSHCFTGAYGVSPVFSGSWLSTPWGLRRFTPEEISRLMGFADSFRIDVPKRAKAWKLIGNSVSVDAVRCMLGAWY